MFGKIPQIMTANDRLDMKTQNSLDELIRSLCALKLIELSVVVNRAIEQTSATKAEAIRKTEKLLKFLGEWQEDIGSVEDLRNISVEQWESAIKSAKTDADRALFAHASLTAHPPESKAFPEAETDLRTRDVNASLSDLDLAISNVSAAYDCLTRNGFVVDVSLESNSKSKSQKVYRLTQAGIARAVAQAQGIS